MSTYLKKIYVVFEQVKNALSRNKLKKFLSLLMAIALWFYVMGAQNPVIEDSYNVKVRLKSTSYDYKAFFQNQDIKVTLSAPRSYFIDYNENDIYAYIDLAGYEEGEYDVPVNASFPKGFELNKIAPETIHVKIEPIIERQMEVTLTVSGSPKPNTIINEIQAPQNVTIIGPKNIVNSVQKVIGYVGVVGEGDDFELNVPLSAIDENGREVQSARVAPSSINVFVDVEPSIKKTVPVIANVTAPNGMEISRTSIEPANVEIEGVAEVINAIDSLKTKSVNISKGTDTYIENLDLIIPDGIKSSVEDVTIFVELKKTSAKVEPTE